MSTRANIIIRDEIFNDSLIFYRHSDGYPKGTLPTLKKFMLYVCTGRIRDNVEQSAGWLILIGAKEYEKVYAGGGLYHTKKDITIPEKESNKSYSGMEWKCGSYEPATGIHPDIEYLYELNLTKKTIEIKEVIDTERQIYRTIEVIHCNKNTVLK
jgi:hypothetical protein